MVKFRKEFEHREEEEVKYEEILKQEEAQKVEETIESVSKTEEAEQLKLSSVEMPTTTEWSVLNRRIMLEICSDEDFINSYLRALDFYKIIMPSENEWFGFIKKLKLSLGFETA
jgi:hypothetical protein